MNASAAMTYEPDLFDGCESIDEILFVMLDHSGPEGLQALLAQADLDREDLSQAAERLEQAGLQDAAITVRDAATKAPSRASIKIAAILADPFEGNRKAYLAQAYRQNRVTIEALEAAKVDDDTLDYIERAKVIRKFRR